MGRGFGWLVFLVGAASLAAVTFWLVTAEPEAAESAGRPPYVLPVVLGEAQKREVKPVVRLTGEVRSSRDAQLAFLARGVVEEWHVREGDRVERGQELGALYATEEELELASAEADLVSATRELEKLEAGTREEEKRRIAADLDAARAEEAVAEQDARRTRTLAKDKILSVSELDRQDAQLRAASARVAAAEARLAEAEAGSREEDLQIARARVGVQRAAVTRAEHELSKTRLLAPFDGIVTRRLASTGDYVEVGEGVLEVVDIGALEVDVEIPSSLAARLDAGARVRLTLDEDPSFALDTELDALIPVAQDASRNFRGVVRIGAEEAASSLRSGHFVRVELALETVANAVVVPPDAVRTVDNGSVVVAARGEESLQAVWVPVRVLATDANGTAVEPLGDGQLAAGEQVVVVGVDLAFPGAPLLPRSRGDEAAQEGSRP